MRVSLIFLVTLSTLVSCAAAPTADVGESKAALRTNACGWSGITVGSTNGDLNAYYAGMAALKPADVLAAMHVRIDLKGAFPVNLRYFGLSVYNRPPSQMAIDWMHDSEIDPDAGSTNPFRGGNRSPANPRNYVAHVQFGDPPAGQPLHAGNTIYVPASAAFEAPNLFFRAYYPDLELGTGKQANLRLAGNEALPTLSAIDTQTGAAIDMCSLFAADAPSASVSVSVSDSASKSDAASERAASNCGLPHFCSSKNPRNPGGLNGDAIYFSGNFLTKPSADSVVVVSYRVPSFSDTYHHPLLPIRDSVNEGRFSDLTLWIPDGAVEFSLADSATAQDQNGNAVVVLASQSSYETIKAALPANATFVDVTSYLNDQTRSPGLLTRRHILPNATSLVGMAKALVDSDPQYAQGIASAQLKPLIGDAYPTFETCTVASYVSRACGH